MIRTYAGWWEVPEHLMSAGSLADLEFPRVAPKGLPAAWVETRDWRDKRASVALYDARTAAVSTATGAQLEAAAARSSKPRTCDVCRARCQRSLPTDIDDRPLCPACRQVALLRLAQNRAAEDRADAAATAAKLLDQPDTAIVQVDLTVPPPTPAGRARPATAARVRAVDVAGARLLDVTVRLVGPRAQHVPPAAVAREQAAPNVHRRLLGRPLIVWNDAELTDLRTAVPHQDWPRQCSPVRDLSARWRGQLDPRTRQLLPSLSPGSPDRLLVHLRRAAASAG